MVIYKNGNKIISVAYSRPLNIYNILFYLVFKSGADLNPAMLKFLYIFCTTLLCIFLY